MSDYEREDLELQNMMGEKFEDMSKANYNTANQKNTAEKPTKKAKDAEWHPIKERNWMDDLTDCTKSAVLFGGLSMLVWYWEISGLMDESIALPCMLVCAVLAGLGIGKVVGGK
jgi:hypothetical protein